MSDRKTLANPLQALIAQAGRTLPATTGVAASYRNRIGIDGPTVVLLDCSASMADRAGSRTKIEILRAALADLAPDLACARLIAFSSTAGRVASVADLPPAAGGTALHLALDLAAGIAPGRTLVLTDGHPDDARAALTAADRLRGRIDGIFCGPDSDAEGLAFLQQLCRLGCGSAVRCDVVRQPNPTALAAITRQVLALESRP